MQLSEKYRPHTWPDLTGLDRIKGEIEAIRASSATLSGQAYWISGRSGQGKTCIARLIASESADQWHTIELAGRKLTTSTLDDLRAQWRFRGLGEKQGWALIVNEAHGMSKPVIEDLLDFLEDIPAHCLVVFTTTTEGAAAFEAQLDAQPLIDRCNVLQIRAKEPGLALAFAQRAQDIARAEHLDGRPIAAYQQLAKDFNLSLRRMLGEIAKGRMIERAAL